MAEYRLTASDIEALHKFVAGLNELTQSTGVILNPEYGGLEINDKTAGTIHIEYGDESGYVLDVSNR